MNSDKILTALILAVALIAAIATEVPYLSLALLALGLIAAAGIWIASFSTALVSRVMPDSAS